MENYVASSTPARRAEVRAQDTSQVVVQLQHASRSIDEKIDPMAFLDAPAWSAARRHELRPSSSYCGYVAPWTQRTFPQKLHVVEMDEATAARAGGDLEYHARRTGYYGGDEHSWQRYTRAMPLQGTLTADVASLTLRFTLREPLRSGQWYGIVLQHYAFCMPGCHSDVVIPFFTRHEEEKEDEAGGSSSMQIFVRTLTGIRGHTYTGKTITLDVEPSDTIAEIKLKIHTRRASRPTSSG